MQNIKLARNRKHQGMAGYVSEGDLMRYRMLRDQGTDRRIRPRHPSRYEYKTIGDKAYEFVAIILFVLAFAWIPAVIAWMVLDPVSRWMW